MSYLQDETDAPPFDQRVYGITIATDAADLEDRIDIIVPNLDGNVRWPDARWQARDGYTLPKRGMEGVAVLDDNNEFWVIGWWPEHLPITVGKASDGPPSDPQEGDIWYATQVDAAGGITWQFIYDTSGSTSYKWKFVGGPAWFKKYNTAPQLNTSDNTWQKINNPTHTIPIAGDYLVKQHGRIYAQGATTDAWLGAWVNGNEQGDAVQYKFDSNIDSVGVEYSELFSGLNKNTTVNPAMYTGNHTLVEILFIAMEITPVRVG